MSEGSIPLHETLKLHELINYKTISIIKSKMTQGLVFNQDLKSLLKEDVRQSLDAVNELQTLYAQGSEIQ
jgi:similar to spore coat protein